MAAISAAAAAKPYNEWISGNDPDGVLITALVTDILNLPNIPRVTIQKMKNGTDLLISFTDGHIIMQPSGAINTQHHDIKSQCENYNLGMGIEFIE